MYLRSGVATLAEALALGPALLARVEVERVPFLIASVVQGPAVVLGAAQRAGRVVRLDACAASGTEVWRRATSGTAAYVGRRAILWTLALPHVAALAPDATARTLLNRNVRGFLRGLSRGGAIAHYFGREWISVRHRPAALLGFEVSPGGAVLIELIAGVDAPVAVPEALAADEERALDRWLGKVPGSLGELLIGDALEIAREVSRTVALRAVAPIEGAPDIEVTPLRAVTRADDPLPPGFVPGPLARVPIGWIDTALHPATGRLWLGGDVLVPAHVRAGIAEGSPLTSDAPVDGASLYDLRQAAAQAAGGRARPPA